MFRCCNPFTQNPAPVLKQLLVVFRFGHWILKDFFQKQLQAQKKKALSGGGMSSRRFTREELKLERRKPVQATQYLSAGAQFEHKQSKSKHKQGIFECKCRVLSESITKSDHEINQISNWKAE